MKENGCGSSEGGRERLPTIAIKFEGIIVEDCFENYSDVSLEDIPDRILGNDPLGYNTSQMCTLANVIIYTNIDNTSAVEEFLENHHIKYHTLNTHPFEDWRYPENELDADIIISEKNDGCPTTELANNSRYEEDTFNWQLVHNRVNNQYEMPCKRFSEMVSPELSQRFRRTWLFVHKEEGFSVLTGDAGNGHFSFLEVLTDDEIEELKKGNIPDTVESIAEETEKDIEPKVIPDRTL